MQEVERRETARRMADAGVEGLVAPLVDVRDALEAPPDRAEPMLGLRLAQLQHAGQESGTAGRVDHPASGDALALARPDHGHAVRRAPGAEFETGDLDARPHLDAVVPIHLEEVALHARAIDLERRVEGEIDRSDLAHLGERGVALGPVEEVANPVLRQVSVVQIPGQPLAANEVVAGDLHQGLAHLERGLSTALEDRHAHARQAPSQLAGQKSACQPATEDRDVEIDRSWFRGYPRSPR